MRYKDLTGRRFGRLHVIKFGYRAASGGIYWRCVCDCGSITYIRSSALVSGGQESCGCSRKGKPRKDLTGMSFGYLRVLYKAEEQTENNTCLWVCVCVCGKLTKVETGHLNRGSTRSCGCMKAQLTADKNRIDITGQVFGSLTALHIEGNLWVCQCICGERVKVSAGKLRSGNKRICNRKKHKGTMELKRGARASNIKLGHRHDITGVRFGKLTVIGVAEEQERNQAYKWKCVCDCGTRLVLSKKSLYVPSFPNCGCVEIEQMIRRRFGRLVALDKTEERIRGSVVWKCQCDCGNIVYVPRASLVSLLTQSCGCLMCKGDVFLYVFLSLITGLVKIGVSGNIGQRKNSLEKKLNDSFEIIFHKKSSMYEEQQIHKQLNAYKDVHPNQPNGKEWFSLPEEYVSLIRKFGEVCY